jgi:hypothetical protein
MPYIGRGTDKISNIEVLDNITFDGSSSYSITKSSVAFVPNSAQSLLISIDGVVQATNFSVSTSTIDFGVAVPSTSTCDFFLHYGTGVLFTPADGTVTEAKIGSNAVTTAKIEDGAITSAKINSSVGLGITEADMFRLTAYLTSNANPISSNLERVDDATFSKIGTGMSLSSGVYTFPTTGLYYITYTLVLSFSASDVVYIDLNVSSDSGSTYDRLARTGIIQTANSLYQTNSAFVNVTNASTFRVKFSASSVSNVTILGETTENLTSFTFIRLGDSQ